MIQTKNFDNYLLALKEYPELKLKDAPRVGIKQVSNLHDLKAYHLHYKQEEKSKTQSLGITLVNTIDDLILFKSLYGNDEFVDQRLLEFVPTTNLEEAKILSENFPLSKHINKIQLNYLSKVKSIDELIFSKEAEKHFGVNSRFNFKDMEAIQNLAILFESKLPDPVGAFRLKSLLFDKHIDHSIGKLTENTFLKQLDQSLSYVKRHEWMGAEYTQSKEKRMLDSHHSSSFPKQGFSLFYLELERLLSIWQWNAETKYITNAIFIESYKGAKRIEKGKSQDKTKIEKILFEEVDNKIFEDLSEGFKLDDFAYIRMSGLYKIHQTTDVRLPFHVVFKLDNQTQSFDLEELIISDKGVSKSFYNGKVYKGSIFYNHLNGKLIRRGK